MVVYYSYKTSTTVRWIGNCIDRNARGQLADTAAYASGKCCVCTQQMAALFCVKWRHGCPFIVRRQSVNRCVFTWRTIVPNFIPIRSEMTKPWALLKRSPQEEEEEEEGE